MRKINLIKTLVLIAVLVFGFNLAGCSLPVVYAGYVGEGDGTYRVLEPIMNAGETITVNKDSFKGLDSYYNAWGMDNIDRFELWTYDYGHIKGGTREGVVTIEDNVITAAKSGFTTVLASLYRKGKWEGKNVTFKLDVRVAEIYVINEATMTHITTAQELADMKNDLGGHYILKADIDLADWGEWKAIDNADKNNQGFTGMFVNPYGYKIKNLTVSTCETMLNGNVGLFGVLRDRAIVKGIILEDIFIDVSDYEGIAATDPLLVGGIWPFGSPTVGGIAACMGQHSIISDCSVSGTIIGGGTFTGGIVGANSAALIMNCTFTGTLKNHKAILDQMFAVGGITGVVSEYDRDLIINCTVVADIDGGKHASAGGIIGSVYSLGKAVNSSFVGTIVSDRSAGTMIGYDQHSDGPIDFEESN